MGLKPLAFDPFAAEGDANLVPLDFDPFEQAPAHGAAASAADGPGAFSRGFVSGLLDQNPTMLAETMEGLSHLAPEPFRDSLRSGSADVRSLAALSPDAYKPRAKSLFDSRNVSDALDWAGEAIGQGLASTVPSLVTGAAGAVAGSRVGGKVGGTVGALTGAAVPSAALNYGEVYKALKDEGVEPPEAAEYAGYATGPMVALDTVSVGPIVSRLGGLSEAKRQVARGIAKRIAAEGGKGVGREGITEAAQETVKEATVSLAADKPFWTEETAKKVAEAGVAGAMVGGVMGSGAGVVPDRPAAPRARGVREEAAERPPEVTPADVSSPIPTDLIAEGKRVIADAQASSSANDILSRHNLPPIDTRVTLDLGDGPMTGTVADAFTTEVEGFGSDDGIRIVLDDGREIDQFVSVLRQGGVTILPIISPKAPASGAEPEPAAPSTASADQARPLPPAALGERAAPLATAPQPGADLSTRTGIRPRDIPPLPSEQSREIEKPKASDLERRTSSTPDEKNVVPSKPPAGGGLFVQIGNRRIEVGSLEEASRRYLVAKARAEDAGKPIARPFVVDADGNVTGHIADNGRVFAGLPEDWKTGTELLYDSRVPGGTLDQIVTERAKARAVDGESAPRPEKPEHPGLIVKSLETGKTTEIQPEGTRAPEPTPEKPAPKPERGLDRMNRRAADTSIPDWQLTEGEFVTRKVGPKWAVARQNRTAGIDPDAVKITQSRHRLLQQQHRRAVLDAIERGDDVPEIVLRTSSYDADFAKATEAKGRKALPLSVPLDPETGRPKKTAAPNAITDRDWMEAVHAAAGKASGRLKDWRKVAEFQNGFAYGAGAMQSRDGIADTAVAKQGIAAGRKWAKENPRAGATRAEPAPEKPEKPERIEDFGEKIEGARKDTFAGFRDALRENVDVIAEPLSKSFPQPNYEKLAAAGVPKRTLATIAVMRDTIPNRPRQAWKAKRWAGEVETVRSFSRMLLDGEIDIAEFERRASEAYELQTIPLTARAIEDVAPADLPKAAQYRVNSAAYSMLNGQRYSPAKTFWFLEGPKRRSVSNPFGNDPSMSGTYRETPDEGVDLAKRIIAHDLEQNESQGQPARSKYTEVGVYRDRSTKEAFLGFKVRSTVIRLKAGFDDGNAAREYLAENRDEIQAKIDDLRKGPNMRGTENRPRQGESLREGDVTPESFMEAFRFRRVQFGNYVEGPRRQEDLNRAFDALMDLADVLGIPQQALSLNGSLGLAFGARGRGGRNAAAAHYESGNVVINLTKGGGPGSLAHEWLHALDNYFARQDEASGYMSERRRADGPVRAEVYRAWKEIEKTLAVGGFADRSAEFDRARSKPYWNTTIEKAARAFERYIIDRLSEKGAVNDYLANIDMTGGAYPTAEEMTSGIRTAYDKLFETIDTRKTDQGVELLSIPRRTLRAVPADRANGIERDLAARLERAGLSGKIAIKVVESIAARTGKATPAQGRYGNRLIEVALTAEDPNWALDHETVHALKDLGVIRPAEWTTLRKAALTDDARMADVRDRYAERNLSEEATIEEVVADMYADWAAERSGAPARGFLKTAFQRIRAFFKALAASLRESGYRTPEDLFEGIERGTVGRREGVAAEASTERLAAAYHGSPHDFDAFTTDRIGTGEGAQAYGWGLYFAGREGVARHYRDKLSPQSETPSYKGKTILNRKGEPMVVNDDWVDQMDDILKFAVDENMTLAEAIKDIRAAHSGSGIFRRMFTTIGAQKRFADFLEERGARVGDAKTGRLYKVNLAPAEDEYLYWDKPLSEQSESVLARLKAADLPYRGSLPGGTVYEAIAEKWAPRVGGHQQGQRRASEELRAADIPGIKYLDGASRNKTFKDIKRQFLDALPEDADFTDINVLIGTGHFTPEQDAVLRALAKNDWLGFDYPSQAISAAYSRNAAAEWDMSQELVKAISASRENGTYNYVIFDESLVAIEEKLSIPRDAGFVRMGGSPDLGNVSADVAEAIGREAAPIRLRAGDGQSGLRHIEDRHGADVRAMGYADAAEMVADVARNYDAVYKSLGRSLILAKREPSRGHLYVTLEPSADGSYYDVKSATPSRSDQFSKKVPLWERAGPSASSAEADPLDPRGESGPDNIGPEPAEDNGDEKLSIARRRDRSAAPFSADWSLPSERAWDYLHDRNLTLLERIKLGGRAGADVLRWRLQDRFLPIKRAQEAIERVRRGAALAEDSDAYLAEELYYGRTGKRLDDFKAEHVEPLVKAIREEGLTLAEVEEYLYARHAPERNDRIAEINPELPDGGSGMTHAEARRAMTGFRKDGKIDGLRRIAERVDSIARETMKARLDGGLIDEATARQWRETYRYYVPLRGFAEAAPDGGDGRPRTGRGFDIRGAESKRALGRESRAADLLANVLSMHEEAIVRAEKNKVGQAFLKLVSDNPNATAWEVDKVETTPRIDKETGLVVHAVDPRYTLRDNVVAVKKDGETHHITLHHDGLARAMKNVGADTGNMLLRSLQTVNRWLAFVNTSAAPEFLISNFARDVQAAEVNLQGIDDAKGIRLRILLDVPKAIRGAYRGLRGETEGDWTQGFHEYAKAGGKTAFFALDDITKQRKRIESELRRLDPDALDRLGIVKDATERAIQDVNGAVENGVRLSTYVNLRRRGVPESKAASIARNLTVNFNRKGEWAGTAQALYLFYNASLQGTVRLVQALGHPRVRKVVVGIVVGSAMLEIVNGLLSPDDDDDEKKYDKIPDWTKHHNLIVVNPFADPSDEDGMFEFKVPMPYGYNVFAVIGQKLGRAVRAGLGIGPVKYDPLKDAMDVAAVALGSFNPLGGEDSIVKTVIPTVLKPLYELETNKNFTGGPIMPDQPPYGPKKPDSERHFRGVNSMAKDIAKILNEATGGNAVRPGAIDVSPETLEHWVQFVTGGQGTFVARSTDLFAKILKGKTDDIAWNDVPFARRVVEGKNQWYAQKRYYEIREASDMAVAEVKALVKAGEGEKASVAREKYFPEIAVARRIDTVDGMLKQLRQNRRAVEVRTDIEDDARDAAYKRIDRQIEGLMVRAIRQYNDLVRLHD